MSSIDTSINALNQFTTYANHQEEDPSIRRVVLKIVTNADGQKQLEAKEVTLRTRFDILFHHSDYKLESVIEFLESNPVVIQTNTPLTFLLKKVEKHNSGFFTKHINPARITALMRKIISPTTKESIPPRAPSTRIANHRETPPTPMETRSKTTISSPSDTRPKAKTQTPPETRPKKAKSIHVRARDFLATKAKIPLPTETHPKAKPPIPPESRLETRPTGQKPVPRRAQTYLEPKARVTQPAPKTTHVSTPPIIEATAKIGGMRNPGINACYINSTLQALRLSPHFKELLKNRVETLDNEKEIKTYISNLKTTSMPPQAGVEKTQFIQDAICYLLSSIYKDLEKNKIINEKTIQSLRALVFSLEGPREADSTTTSQEDARVLSQKLLEAVNCEQIRYKMDIKHSVKGENRIIPIPSLQPRSTVATILPIQLGITDDDTTFQDLVTDSLIMEELDKSALLNPKNLTLSDRERKEIDKLDETSETPTLQIVTLEDPAPPLLVLALVRYTWDGNKIQTAIKPVNELIVPISGTNQSATYRLASATVHSGISVRGGHYYSYGRNDAGNWTEYNDLRVGRVSDNSAIKDIEKNGYLFYYELVSVGPTAENRQNFMPF